MCIRDRPGPVVNQMTHLMVVHRSRSVGAHQDVYKRQGYNHVDIKAARGRIHILRVPSYSPEAVAEFAMALLLTVNRKTHRAYARTRDFNMTIQGLMGSDIYGKTAGVIGTGKIGRAMIRILSGFGVSILAVSYTHLDVYKRQS